MSRPHSFSTQFMALNGLRWDLTALQWQPTLTAHDPNPPITLETAVVAASSVPVFVYQYRQRRV